MKRKYVLASSYQHFVTWCVSKNISHRDGECVYIARPDLLWEVYGEQAEFIFEKTWKEHPQAIRIVQEVLLAMMRPRPGTLIVRGRKIMADEMPKDTFLNRLMTLDPALWRGLIVAIFALLGTIGVTIVPGLPDQLIGLVWIISAIAQALWTRQAVTPNGKVAVAVPDPINAPEVVVAGEATTTATNSEIVAAAKG
jgi:hypothetical protein